MWGSWSVWGLWGLEFRSCYCCFVEGFLVFVDFERRFLGVSGRFFVLGVS